MAQSASASAVRAGQAVRSPSVRRVTRRYGPPTARTEHRRAAWNQIGRSGVELGMAKSNTLSTDFDAMLSVASTTDSRNEEIRAMLQAFISQMSSVPPSVWGGLAAAPFKEVVDRSDVEANRPYQEAQ